MCGFSTRVDKFTITRHLRPACLRMFPTRPSPPALCSRLGQFRFRSRVARLSGYAGLFRRKVRVLVGLVFPEGSMRQRQEVIPPSRPVWCRLCFHPSQIVGDESGKALLRGCAERIMQDPGLLDHARSWLTICAIHHFIHLTHDYPRPFFCSCCLPPNPFQNAAGFRCLVGAAGVSRPLRRRCPTDCSRPVHVSLGQIGPRAHLHADRPGLWRCQRPSRKRPGLGLRGGGRRHRRARRIAPGLLAGEKCQLGRSCCRYRRRLAGRCLVAWLAKSI